MAEAIPGCLSHFSLQSDMPINGDIQVGYQEKFLLRSGWVLAQATQVGGGVTIPAGVTEPWRGTRAEVGVGWGWTS